MHLRIAVSQCHIPTYPRSHPEEEGRWVLPHGEFGLDVIALIGGRRFREHQRLQTRGLAISERAVTHVLCCSEELVSAHLIDQERIKAPLRKQGRVILALDGLQLDQGHEVRWGVRDCLCEASLLARPCWGRLWRRLSTSHTQPPTLPPDSFLLVVCGKLRLIPKRYPEQFERLSAIFDEFKITWNSESTTHIPQFGKALFGI